MAIVISLKSLVRADPSDFFRKLCPDRIGEQGLLPHPDGYLFYSVSAWWNRRHSTIDCSVAVYSMFFFPTSTGYLSMWSASAPARGLDGPSRAATAVSTIERLFEAAESAVQSSNHGILLPSRPTASWSSNVHAMSVHVMAGDVAEVERAFRWLPGPFELHSDTATQTAPPPVPQLLYKLALENIDAAKEILEDQRNRVEYAIKAGNLTFP